MTTFAEKAEKEYDAVLTSGMFFEFFPTLCGDWEKDKTEFLERFYAIEVCRGNIDEYFAQQIADGKPLEEIQLTTDNSRTETAEEHLANNIDGLTDFIEDDDIFIFYKGVIIEYGKSFVEYHLEKAFEAISKKLGIDKEVLEEIYPIENII